MTEGTEAQSRRRDAESDWHDVVKDVCPHCGCTFHRADDDSGMVWDPGRAWDEGCRDRACHCHEDPVIGEPRDE